MRIVIVCHEAEFTGAPRLGFDIAHELSSDNEVTLVSKRAGPLIGLDKYAGLTKNYVVTNTSHATRSIPFGERVRGAVEALEKLKPDLLYANSTACAEWCVAAHQLGIASVLHTHEMAQELKSLFSVDAMRADIPEHVDLLVSASPEATEDFVKSTIGSVPDHFLFGIAIDVDDVKRLADQRVDRPTNASGRTLGDDRTVVAMCGTASARKGFDIFYEAAKALPGADFLWIGPLSDDPKVSQIVQACKEAPPGNLFMTGETTNPYAYMRMCDVFALTSIEDPNPLVVPEALSLGKRVLSFQATGGSWRWTRRFGYSVSGAISAGRLISYLDKMIAAPGSTDWIEAQAVELHDAVDLDVRLPALRERLGNLVGAPI